MTRKYWGPTTQPTTPNHPPKPNQPLVNQLEVLEPSLGLDLIDSQSSLVLYSVQLIMAHFYFRCSLLAGAIANLVPAWIQQNCLILLWAAGPLLEQNCPNQCDTWEQSTSMIVSWSLVLMSKSWFQEHLIIAGGNAGFQEYSDVILEYDPEEDSMIPVGHMTQARSYHAVSVVQAEDYAPWCQWGVSVAHVTKIYFILNYLLESIIYRIWEAFKKRHFYRWRKEMYTTASNFDFMNIFPQFIYLCWLDAMIARRFPLINTMFDIICTVQYTVKLYHKCPMDPKS